MKRESEHSEDSESHPHFPSSEEEITLFLFHLFLSSQHSYIKYVDIYCFIIIIIILQKASQTWLVSSYFVIIWVSCPADKHWFRFWFPPTLLFHCLDV